MSLDALLSDLGAQFGIVLQADAEGSCSLVFDDTLEVTIEAPAEAPDRLFLHSLVGFVPVRNEAAFYAMLLEANRFGSGTGGNVLSVETGMGTVLLHRDLPLAALSVQTLTTAIENFVNQARHWSEKVMTFVPPAEDAPAPGGEDYLVRP